MKVGSPAAKACSLYGHSRLRAAGLLSSKGSVIDGNGFRQASLWNFGKEICGSGILSKKSSQEGAFHELSTVVAKSCHSMS